MIAYRDVPHVVLGRVPEFRPVYEEHVRDNDEVLPHRLLGALTRFVLDAHERGDDNLVDRVLHVLDRLMAEGDDDTQNLVAVSFIEDIEYGDKRADTGFIARWGRHLREERERQQQWSDEWGKTRPDVG